MIESIIKIKKIIEDISPNKYSTLTILPVIILILGFFIWNIYLYALGFSEGEFLESKFLLSGTLFLLITLVLVFFIYYLYKILTFLLIMLFKFLLKKSSKIKLPKKIVSNKIILRFFKFFVTIFFIIIFFVWLIVYVLLIFPNISAVIGGGQPKVLSFYIKEEDSLKLLQTIGIVKAEGGDYQTENLCVINENNNFLYILRNNRVLAIKKDMVVGLGTLPGLTFELQEECVQFARIHVFNGFAGNLFLTYNLTAKLTGLNRIYINYQ